MKGTDYFTPNYKDPDSWQPEYLLTNTGADYSRACGWQLSKYFQ